MEHNCGASKLQCIDCSGPICPRCLVQCPVGNRCKNCTKRFDSHLLKVNFGVIARALLGSAVLGFLFNVLDGFLPLGGFYMLFLAYFIGGLAGGLLFQISGRKIGPKVATTVAIGLLLGSLSSGLVWQNIQAALIGMPPGIHSRAHRAAPAEKQIAKGASTNEAPATSSNLPYATTDDDVLQAYRTGMPTPQPISFSLIIFALGVLSPFVGWSLPLPFSFRR
jgi:hypothetical protein